MTHVILRWEAIGGNEADWTKKAEIGQKYILVSEAFKAVFWPTPDFTEGTFDSFWTSVEGEAFISACAVAVNGHPQSSHHVHCYYKRTQCVLSYVLAGRGLGREGD